MCPWFSPKRARFSDFSELILIVKFHDFPWRWPTYIMHFIVKKLIDQVKEKQYFQKKNKNMYLKIGRTHFQKVRPKEKQCAMTGALFSEKCARGNFSAPFAQWRSPNASLKVCHESFRRSWACDVFNNFNWGVFGKVQMLSVQWVSDKNNVKPIKWVWLRNLFYLWYLSNTGINRFHSLKFTNY